MNTRKGILGLLLMALLPLSAQTAERGLKECIRMGIERNLGLKNARIGIEAGRTTVSQARANLLPQVNGTLQAGDYLKRPVNVTTSTLLGADFPDTPTWGKVRSMPLTAQGAIQVGVPLYNATIYAAINAAKVVESLNRTAYEKARLDLAVQIAHVYFMAQATLENRYLLDENIERMDSLCRITEALYHSGVVLEIDYTRVDINRKNLIAQRDQVVMLYGQQMNLMRFLLNLDATEPIDVARMPQDITKLPIGGLNEQLPELQLIDQKLSLLDKQIRQTRAGYLPSVTLAGQVGYMGFQECFGDFFKGSESNWFGNAYVGLNVSIPLFDANKRKLQIRQYRHEQEQTRNNRRLQHAQLQEQYNNAVLQIAQTERMFMTQRENLRQSTDVYGVTEIKYKEGVSSMTELLQDEMRLREAQGNLVSAHYQFNKSQVDLLRLSGNLDEIINE